MKTQDRARIAKQFQPFVGQPENYSARVNIIIGRYESIINDSMPALTEGEWLVICDANNGTVFPSFGDDKAENDPARYAWMNVADSDPMNAKEQFGVDNLDLARKMKAMNFIEQCGVMEVIQKFWEKSDEQFEGNRAMLEDAGAKVK